MGVSRIKAQVEKEEVSVFFKNLSLDPRCSLLCQIPPPTSQAFGKSQHLFPSIHFSNHIPVLHNIACDKAS